MTSIPIDCLAYVVSPFSGDPYALARTCRPLLPVKGKGVASSWRSIQQAKQNDTLLATYVNSVSPLLSVNDRMATLHQKMVTDLKNMVPRIETTYTHPLELKEKLKNVSLKKAWPRMREEIVNAGVQQVPPDNANVRRIRRWFATNPNLSHVHRLELDGLNLAVIPNEIRHFTNLRYLHLQGNGIQDIPPDIFSSLTQLLTLNLADNLIQEIPETAFRNLTNMFHLNLSRNRLQKLPAGLFQGLTEIYTILLSGNWLRTLPETVFQGVRKLEHLDASGNLLESLRPRLFHDTPILKTVDLSRNRLSYLLETLFHRTPQLELLSLNENQLEEIDGNTFQNLNHLNKLNLSYNKLRSIPVTFVTHPQLNYLWLYGNPNPLQNLTLTQKLALFNRLPISSLEDLPANGTERIFKTGILLKDKVRDFPYRNFLWKVSQPMQRHPKITAAVCSILPVAATLLYLSWRANDNS